MWKLFFLFLLCATVLLAQNVAGTTVGDLVRDDADTQEPGDIADGSEESERMMVGAISAKQDDDSEDDEEDDDDETTEAVALRRDLKKMENVSTRQEMKELMPEEEGSSATGPGELNAALELILKPSGRQRCRFPFAKCPIGRFCCNRRLSKRCCPRQCCLRGFKRCLRKFGLCADRRGFVACRSGGRIFKGRACSVTKCCVVGSAFPFCRRSGGGIVCSRF